MKVAAAATPDPMVASLSPVLRSPVLPDSLERALEDEHLRPALANLLLAHVSQVRLTPARGLGYGLALPPNSLKGPECPPTL